VGDGECQCGKCKSGQKNRDSRGRHHAKCHCKLCDLYRGRTPETTATQSTTPSNAATPGTQADGGAAFDDLPGMAPAPAVAIDVNYDVMAKMYFDLSTGGLVMVFGEEWKPTSEAERDNVCVALKAYLAAKGVQDVSPGWLLAFVVLAYSAPRLRQPTTSSKLKVFGGWFKDKLVYPVWRWFKRPRFYSAPKMMEDEPNKPNKEQKQ
jgi:hypothetical protein